MVAPALQGILRRGRPRIRLQPYIRTLTKP